MDLRKLIPRGVIKYKFEFAFNPAKLNLNNPYRGENVFSRCRYPRTYWKLLKIPLPCNTRARTKTVQQYFCKLILSPSPSLLLFKFVQTRFRELAFNRYYRVSTKLRVNNSFTSHHDDKKKIESPNGPAPQFPWNGTNQQKRLQHLQFEIKQNNRAAKKKIRNI